MYLTKYIKLLIGSLTILTLTTLVSVNSQAETCTTNALGDRTCTTSTAGTTTGNVLTNSTFGTGSTYSTQDWTISGDVGHGHNGAPGTTYTGQNTSGGVLAFEGDPTGKIYQDVDLVGDGKLTQAQINEGFTSTMSADIWFWNNKENTFTLKQTITAGDGTVTTQTRNINDHDPNRSMNSGQWTNYTDSYTEASNTQTDFTIRAEVYNDTAGTSYDGAHYGPDVDNVQLSVTTAGEQSTTFTPCQELGTCTSAGEDIQDAVNLTTDDGVDLFQDLDTKVEDAVKDFEEVKIVSVDTTIEIKDDLGEIEEVKFEEFVQESFTEFLETNDLVEEFKTELEVEGISEEEFYEELAGEMMEELGGEEMFAELEEPKMEEAEISDEPVEEIKEESIEEVKEEEIKEESNQEESNEPEPNTNEEIKEESNEATEESEASESVSNESEMAEDKETEGTKEEETDGENVEDEAVESDEQEDISIKENSINVKVQKVLDKVLSKLKRVDQKLQAIQLVTSKGITAGEADLSGYINKRIYTKQVALNGVPNPDFFQNLNILEQQQIYKDANLAAYVSNDPIAVKQKLLQEINVDKQRLLLELKALKNEG
jgi:hypothetical protein